MSSSTSSATSRRPVVVLGATGSIGRQALDVASALGYPVAGLAANRPGPDLAALASAHPDARVVAVGGSSGERSELSARLGDRVSFGPEELVALASSPGAIVVNGIVGVAGLAPSVAAARAGNRLALANKESLVAGADVVSAAVAEGGAELIPVDSEHSALFQLLAGRDPAEVAGIILTASGGPFRGRTAEEIADVTPADALRHPTWDMGRRISVDSATLANKGLEALEARALFGIGLDSIDVVVHPQSIVHSLVALTDGSLLAHLGPADMRIPIELALTYPARGPLLVEPLRLPGTSLTFEAPDRATFRALDLAYEAGRRGGTAPAVFNAADEVAVSAFLAGRLGFLGIAEVIERTLAAVGDGDATTVEGVLAADREARETAASLLGGGC